MNFVEVVRQDGRDKARCGEVGGSQTYIEPTGGYASGSRSVTKRAVWKQAGRQGMAAQRHSKFQGRHAMDAPA